jgi:hypothetical protein
VRGQALVEFALVLPLLMFILLGFGEAAFLFAVRHGYQNGVDVMAQWAAHEMSETPGESWQANWARVVSEEQARTGCDATPVVSFPDVTHGPGDRVLVDWPCHYRPRLTMIWDGLTVSVESEAVVPSSATPSPSPS